MVMHVVDTPGYDRIYCGAACPVEHESFMKNLLNINGLLIMPLNDQVGYCFFIHIACVGA